MGGATFTNPFGSGSSTSSVGVVETGTQQQLDKTQNAIARQQQQNIAAQQAFQKQAFADYPALIDEQIQNALAAEPLAQSSAATGTNLSQANTQFVLGGGNATPEQQALIGNIANQAIASGTSDIRQATTENLDILRNELAGSLGLRPSDTPIIDRGSLVSREGLRQESQLISAVRGAESQALLDYPLQISQANVQQQSLAEQTRQFQEQLKQQAFSNRLQLTSLTGGQGVQLASLGAPFQAAVPIAETRSKQSGSAGTGEVAGGIGAILQGVGSIVPG